MAHEIWFVEEKVVVISTISSYSEYSPFHPPITFTVSPHCYLHLPTLCISLSFLSYNNTTVAEALTHLPLTPYRLTVTAVGLMA
jgi:hypothetical protein